MSDQPSHRAAHPHAHLRPATLADLPGILEIEKTSFAHDGERFGPERVRHLLRSKRAIALVADRGGELLGWGVALVWKRMHHASGRIYGLAVAPAARGLKLGDRMLRSLIEQLRQRGAGRIFLEVRTDNAAAIRLYEKAGFRAIHPLEDFYAKGVHAQRMVMEAGK